MQNGAGLSVAYTPGDGARSYMSRGAFAIAAMLTDRCGVDGVHSPLLKRESLVDVC